MSLFARARAIKLKIDQSFNKDTNIEKVGYIHKKGVQENDQMADIIFDLIRNILDKQYENIPSEPIEVAKKAILDTLGAIVAGSTAEGCKTVVDLAKEWGGKPESTIMVYGGKVPAYLSGLAIGPMARARELGNVNDGVLGKFSTHVDEYILPAAFPMAEAIEGVSGRDFITALVLGEDMLVRLSAASKIPMQISGRHLVRIFGPVATCAKLLDFDEEKMVNAFGLAYAQMVGDMQSYDDGALSKNIKHGLVADAAIKSVVLAEKGITGARNILQGKYGYFNSFEPEHDLAALSSGLGKEFLGVLSSFKRYPSCNATHPAIDASLALIKEYEIEPKDVEEVQARLNNVKINIVGRPEEAKYNPQSFTDSQFSLPYCVSTAIVKKDVFIDDFTPQAIKRPEVRELLRKVKMIVDDSLPNLSTIVTIKTKGGMNYTKRVDYKKGHPYNPMSMEDIVEKFKKCMHYSAKPIPIENVQKVIEMIKNIEELDDVTPLVTLLTP